MSDQPEGGGDLSDDVELIALVRSGLRQVTMNRPRPPDPGPLWQAGRRGRRRRLVALTASTVLTALVVLVPVGLVAASGGSPVSHPQVAAASGRVGAAGGALTLATFRANLADVLPAFRAMPVAGELPDIPGRTVASSVQTLVTGSGSPPVRVVAARLAGALSPTDEQAVAQTILGGTSEEGDIPRGRFWLATGSTAVALAITPRCTLLEIVPVDPRQSSRDAVRVIATELAGSDL